MSFLFANVRFVILRSRATKDLIAWTSTVRMTVVVVGVLRFFAPLRMTESKDCLNPCYNLSVRPSACHLPLHRGGKGCAAVSLYEPHSSSFSTAMKASVGICTVPRERIFFLPSFCFSSSFFFREISPP